MWLAAVEFEYAVGGRELFQINPNGLQSRQQMHSHVVVNSRLLQASRARLPLLNGATLNGRGVFTTVAVYNSSPFLWESHWERLKDHARRAGVARDVEDDEAADSLRRLIGANEVENGLARVTLLARPRSRAEEDDEPASDLLMWTLAAPRSTDDTLALTVSPYRTNSNSPLAGVKAVGYLERVLAWEEAHARDFDEAVVLNERGELSSASTANIFFVRQGTVHTPSLQTGAVAGTVRASVVSLASEMGVPVIEGVYTLHDLNDADEIFLTSSAFGVSLVTTFDFRRYVVPVGSVALRLREAFRQLTLNAGRE